MLNIALFMSVKYKFCGKVNKALLTLLLKIAHYLKAKCVQDLASFAGISATDGEG